MYEKVKIDESVSLNLIKEAEDYGILPAALEEIAGYGEGDPEDESKE